MEAGLVHERLLGRATDRPLQQMADPPLHTIFYWMRLFPRLGHPTVMDVLTRFSLGLVLLLILCVLNVWLLRAIISVIWGSELVIAPFQIIGQTETSIGGTGGLPHTMLARLKRLEHELETAQQVLIESGREKERVASPIYPDDASGGGVPSVPSILPTLPPAIFATHSTADLDARLLQPIDIDLKVGGVEIGRFLPAIQRWFARDRTLSFSIVYDKNRVFVAGDLDALGGPRSSIWMRIPNTDPSIIVEKLAFAILHRKVIATADRGRRLSSTSELEILSEDDFENLVRIVTTAAALNVRIKTFGVSEPEEFSKLLTRIEPLTQKMPRWDALTHLAATIAEGAHNEQRALALYQILQKSADPSIANAEWLKDKLKQFAGTVQEKITEDARFAAEFLNKLFAADLNAPEVSLLKEDFKNAYWDGSKIHVPPQAAYLPDLTYHEAAWPYIQKFWKFEYRGEAGALASSYADVLSILIKQARDGLDAETADWTLAPGAVAWLKGEDVATSADRRPLRSLKAPGTAYDDPVLGKDFQVSRYEDLYEDRSQVQRDPAIHVNSGIPNKAFYETAIRIGSPKAGQIWAEALKSLPPQSGFKKAAAQMLKAACVLFGHDSREEEAVREAWAIVGLDLSNAPTESAGRRKRTTRSMKSKTVLDEHRDPVPDAGLGPVPTVASEPCPAPEQIPVAELPLRPAPGPLFTIEGEVAFDLDSARIKPEFYPTLNEIATALKANPEQRVTLTGHTDSIGSESYNEGLSLRRAEAVAEHLRNAGVAPDRLTVRGAGESRPGASNDTDAGRAQNRRVEIHEI
jgi:OOP family OmpA-OmpF porin